MVRFCCLQCFTVFSKKSVPTAWLVCHDSGPSFIFYSLQTIRRFLWITMVQCSRNCEHFSNCCHEILPYIICICVLFTLFSLLPSLFQVTAHIPVSPTLSTALNTHWIIIGLCFLLSESTSICLICIWSSKSNCFWIGQGVKALWRGNLRWFNIVASRPWLEFVTA